MRDGALPEEIERGGEGQPRDKASQSDAIVEIGVREERNVVPIGPQTPEAGYGKHVYHIYAIRVADRDRLIAALAEKDIHCGIHYPIPVHLLDAYESLNLRKGSFPVAEKSAAEFVSLPMFPELTREQIVAVAEGIKTNVEGAVTRS